MKFVMVEPPYIREKDMVKIDRISGITETVLYKHSPVNEEEIIKRLCDADLVATDIYTNFNRKVLSKLRRVKAIFSQSVGYDNIDIEYAKKRSIRVYNCPGYNANAVGEFIFSLIVSLWRKIPAAQEHVKSGGIEHRIFEGHELRSKTIGIIGSGNVGKRVLEIAKGYRMKLLVNTKHPTNEKKKALGILKFSSLTYLLKHSDIIVIAIPLNKHTKGLISEKELRLMKRSAILVNAARQTIVDEFALAKRLINNQIKGAALDLVLEDPFRVKDKPLLIQEMVNLPNVIVTPHIASETTEAIDALGRLFLDNIRGFLKGDLRNCVNV